MIYSVKLRDPCIYYIEAEADTFPDIKEIMSQRIKDHDFDDLEMAGIEIVQIKEGGLKETYGKEPSLRVKKVEEKKSLVPTPHYAKCEACDKQGQYRADIKKHACAFCATQYRLALSNAERQEGLNKQRLIEQ